jgi:UDP-GlcNAc:undecaprenyl-phosphate GlcNAc-1-phosphate transferase
VNLWVFVVVIGGSAILSLGSVAASIRIAHRVGAVDRPDSERKTQERPIPKLGGVAVALTLLIVVVAALVILDRKSDIPIALSVLGPALGVAILGYIDDIRNINPWVRLGSEAALALIAWFAGTQVNVFGIAVLDAAIMVIWIVAIINGLNLLDNSDGLAGSTVLVSSIGAGLIAVINGQNIISLMAFSISGIAIGFLWHNWYPARVYLGDSGAYFLGFLMAVLAIRLRPEDSPQSVGILIAILLLLLPLVDTTYVVVSRLRRGVHPFTAGRDHLSHKLQTRGVSVPGSVGVLIGLSIVGSIAAVILASFFEK